MKTSIDILSALYQTVNIPLITDLIDGKVYHYSVPDGDLKENISINILNNPNNYLQVGFGNVNVHIREIRSGVPNVAKFKTIIPKLIDTLKDTSNGNYFFQIDDDKGIFKDDNDSMYYYNLKVKYQT